MMKKEDIIKVMQELQAKLAELEAAEATVEKNEEEEDTRPLGQKVGQIVGKTAVQAKVQVTSFWGGVKSELIAGGIFKPSKKKRK